MTEIAVQETRQQVQQTTQLPRPSGYRILCAVPEIDKTYDSGLLKSDGTVFVEQQTTMVLFVVALGPEAYQDKQKFPNGPWCKEGDFIITRAYSGTRVAIHGKEFRIINDDTVDAVVDDPRGYRRAGGN